MSAGKGEFRIAVVIEYQFSPPVSGMTPFAPGQGFFKIPDFELSIVHIGMTICAFTTETVSRYCRRFGMTIDAIQFGVFPIKFESCRSMLKRN